MEHACDNLRPARQWFAESSQIDLQLRLVTALWYFCWTRGDMAEGTRCLNEALARAQDVDPVIRARALNALAMQPLSHGALEQAELILEEAQALSRHVDDRSSVAQILTGLGLLAQRRRQWEQSARVLEEAHACARGVEDAPGITHALVPVRITTLSEGDEERAEQPVGDPEAAYQWLADLRNVHTTRAWLANLAGRRGAMARAVELLQPCFEFGTDTHDTRVLFHRTNVVIWPLAERGDPERMARLVGAQRALLHRTGFTPGPWAPTRSTDAGASIKARLTSQGFDAALTAGRQLHDKEVATLAVSVLTSEADLKGRPAAHDHQRLPSLLSVREQGVLQLVAVGLPNKGIAYRLIIAPTTMNYHLTSIFNKLGVNTRAQAVAAAAQWHLLQTVNLGAGSLRP